jgi:hypothetical protein
MWNPLAIRGLLANTVLASFPANGIHSGSSWRINTSLVLMRFIGGCHKDPREWRQNEANDHNNCHTISPKYLPTTIDYHAVYVQLFSMALANNAS